MPADIVVAAMSGWPMPIDQSLTEIWIFSTLGC
jgi:hypothetical protein